MSSSALITRRTRGRGTRPALILVGLLVPLLSGCVSATPPATSVELIIRHSRFTPDAVRVPLGVTVRFVLRNDDPIDHEWIVGDEAVHATHRTGTHPYHAARPTEVTVPALETRTTDVTFDRPGRFLFICHLPGHEAYGMVGTVDVG